MILLADFSCGKIGYPVRSYDIRLKPVELRQVPRVPIRISYGVDSLRLSARTDSLRVLARKEAKEHRRLFMLVLYSIDNLKRENDSLKRVIAGQRPEVLKSQLEVTNKRLKSANIIAAPIQAIIKSGGQVFIEQRGDYLKVIFVIVANSFLGYCLWLLIKGAFRFNHIKLSNERRLGSR